MMAAILNSAMLDSAIAHLGFRLIQSDSNIIHFTQLDDVTQKTLHFFYSDILTQKLHLFILTQLDDGSHLQIYHQEFSHFAQNSDSN